MEKESSVGLQRAALWCGYIFAALIAIGWLGIAHFIVPAPADLGIQETYTYFIETYHFEQLLGNSIGLIIGAAFLIPASIQMGIMLAQIEGKRPVWSIATAVGGIMISIIIFMNGCMWITAAYRPWATVEIPQMMSDFAWLAFLLGWVYLEIEVIASAIVNLQDKRKTPMVPRWFTWLTLVGATVLMGAAGPAFFQSGPFAYHGILGFYVPMIVWGVWLCVEIFFMLKELKRDRSALAE